MIEQAVVGSIASPFQDKSAGCVELLDAVVIVICHVNVLFAIDRNTVWFIELAIPRSLASPFGDKRAGCVELLDTVI